MLSELVPFDGQLFVNWTCLPAICLLDSKSITISVNSRKFLVTNML